MLLRALRNREFLAKEDPGEWLTRRGYDFQFHTHLTTTQHGHLAIMCYDEGFVLRDGLVVPFDRDEGSSATSP